jgi:hypothetical protein
MLAGTLELQMMADVARIKSDMDRMNSVVARGAKKMEDAFEDLRRKVEGMFAGVGAAAFGMWIKSAIDFADELNDLNKTTDITVSKLSGISLMSKQTGSDLTGMAQAMNKLTLEMGKAPEKFAKIGITAKDPLEAFKQLSDLFRSIQDPQLRAAVAAEALGKGWAAAAPALAQGSAEIERMVARGEALAGITQRDAEMADEFNDSLSELRLALMGTASNLAGDMLPLLTELVKSLTDVTEEANKADTPFNVITETLRAMIVVGGNVAFVINAIAKEIGILAAQAVAVATGNFAQAAEIGRLAREDAEKNRAAFDAWEARMMGAGRTAKVVAADFRESERAFAAAAKLMSPGGSKGLRDFVGGDGKGDSEAKKRAAATLAEAKRVAEERQRLRLKEEADIAKHFQDLKAMEAEDARRTRENAIKLSQESEAALQREVIAAHEAARAAEEQAATYGMSAQQLQAYTLARIEDMREQRLMVALSAEEVDAINKIADARRRAVMAGASQEELQKQMEVWQSIDRTAHDTFVNIFEGGSNVFKKLGQTLKAALLDLLYQMTVKKWIISIGASMGVPGAAMAQTGGGMLGSLFGGGDAAGGGIGSLLSAGSSLMGAGSMFAGTALGGFGAGMGATMTNGLIGGFGANMANIGAMMGGGSFGMALGAAMPYLAPLLLIGTLLSGQFKGEKRVGGQYSGTSLVDSPSGGAIGGAGDAIGATIASINQTLKGLGSSASLTQLVSGLEQSERGKGFAYAGGILSTGATFGQGYGGGGHENRRGNMTSEQALAAFGEELKQATLQALQAANVPGILGDYLRGLGDIDALSGGALDAALARINKALTERVSLEDRLYELTHTQLEVLARNREREITAVDESNRVLLQQIHLEEDLLAAKQESIRISNERMAIEERLLNAQITDEMRLHRARELELASVDESNRALLMQVYYLEDYRAKAELAAEAQREYNETLSQRATVAYTQYVDAIRREGEELRDTMNTHRAFAESLKRLRHDLTIGKPAMLSPEAQYKATRAEFLRLAALAPGDKDRLDNLENVARAFQEASLSYHATSMPYFTDLAMIKGAVQASETAAAVTAITAQQQLAVNQAQLMALGAIQDNTLSAVKALEKLTAAILTALSKPGGGLTLPADVVQGYQTATGTATSQFTANPTVSDAQKYEAEIATYNAWKASGKSIYQVGEQIGWNNATIDAWLAKYDLPAFATGTNFVPQDMVAMIHQGEAIIPRQYNPAAGGGYSDEVCAELRQLREEVRSLRAVTAEGARQSIGIQADIRDNTEGLAKGADLAKIRPVAV